MKVNVGYQHDKIMKIGGRVPYLQMIKLVSIVRVMPSVNLCQIFDHICEILCVFIWIDRQYSLVPTFL